MIVKFEISDTTCLQKIYKRNEADWLEKCLFSCSGRTTLVFSTLMMIDEIEIIIRMAELLSSLDRCISTSEIEGNITFQFENRIKFVRTSNVVYFYDRAFKDQLIDESSVDMLRGVICNIEKYIQANITPIAPNLADMLLNREIKYS